MKSSAKTQLVHEVLWFLSQKWEVLDAPLREMMNGGILLPVIKLQGAPQIA